MLYASPPPHFQVLHLIRTAVETADIIAKLDRSDFQRLEHQPDEVEASAMFLNDMVSS